MNGMCYSTISRYLFRIVPGFTTRHFPLTNYDDQIIAIKEGHVYHYGMGQAGFSLHLSADKGKIILGAPGVHFWTGTTMILDESLERNSYGASVINVTNDSSFQYDDYFGKLNTLVYTCLKRKNPLMSMTLLTLPVFKSRNFSP